MPYTRYDGSIPPLAAAPRISVTQRIEDYALIGDTATAALVGKNGSIDWLCLPRFDSPAAFAAILGDDGNGYWRIAPRDAPERVTRAYRPGTLVLDTTFASSTGQLTLTDFMVLDGAHRRIVRMVRCDAGRVAVHMEYVVRFDYGSIVPWVRRTERGLLAVAGPDALLLAGDIETEARGLASVADFELGANECATFELTYFASHEASPEARTPGDALAATELGWRTWCSGCTYVGPYREIVHRSLVTLKALTYAPTGGIVAAPTASLPERLGGVRNWDYRYCWLRDATFTLYALLAAGYIDGARDWRNWLLRAVAGSPSELQIVYSIRGARRLPEIELPWLAGYGGAAPVRLGTDAHGQFQLDVYGEVVDLLYASHRFGIEHTDDEWRLSKAVIAVVEERWSQPDRGLWEVRGGARHFTHSKVMAWVALDRAVRSVEEFGLDGPLERWRATRDAIHADICANAFDTGRNAFVQSYGSHELDASTLLIPIVGFLPASDPRVCGTVAAIERELVRDGLVYRYTQRDDSADGLPPGEGAFLACSFWLVDNYALAERDDEAHALYTRLLALGNDVGLFAEEYDPAARCQVGNFPQAFSHVGLINSGFNLTRGTAPARERADTRR
ncbi:MAG: glycoside hydrolase family 15 protein [Vulcanimicrobiaceae bacterium]